MSNHDAAGDAIGDEFVGFGADPVARVDPPRPDGRGRFTISGEARNVRSFTEDTGWGNTRQTNQVVSFTIDEFEPGGLRRSVYAEIRGRSIPRRPVENEPVTVTGEFADGRLNVQSWHSMRDDPALPVNRRVPWHRRHRRLILIGGAAAVVVVLVACVGPALFVRKFFDAMDFGPPPQQRTEATQSPPSPTIRDASGSGPWTISGQGYTFEFVSVRHTRTTPWMGSPTPSLTVQGFVTRTQGGDMSTMGWEIRNQDGVKLDAPVLPPDENPVKWEQEPTLGQRLPIVLVVYDAQPRSTTLTITLSDFFRRDEGLILRGIPVPAR